MIFFQIFHQASNHIAKLHSFQLCLQGVVFICLVQARVVTSWHGVALSCFYEVLCEGVDVVWMCDDIMCKEILVLMIKECLWSVSCLFSRCRPARTDRRSTRRNAWFCVVCWRFFERDVSNIIVYSLYGREALCVGSSVAIMLTHTCSSFHLSHKRLSTQNVKVSRLRKGECRRLVACREEGATMILLRLWKETVDL